MVLLGLLFLPDAPALAAAAAALPALLYGLAERCCGCCGSSCTSGKLLLRPALLLPAGTAMPLAAGTCGDAVMLLLLCLLRGLLPSWLGEPARASPGPGPAPLLVGEPARPVVRLLGCSEASMLLSVAAGAAATGWADKQMTSAA